MLSHIPHLWKNVNAFSEVSGCFRTYATSTFRTPITKTYSTPKDLLKMFGRKSEDKLNVESWDQLWKLRGIDMKEAGLAVKDRRYILWALERTKQGAQPEHLVKETTPKKTIRGYAH